MDEIPISDDEKLAKLRSNVGKAVQEFMEYQQALFYQRENSMVLGWAVACEYSNIEWERLGLAASGVIVPDGQMAATSVGMLHRGLRHWDT